MKYRCVSYPAFEPNQSWLRKVLLFVDEVYRIVPLDVDTADSDDLKSLMDACKGAVLRCDPINYIELPEEMTALFGKALDRPEFANIANAKKRTFAIKDGKLRVDDWEFLHVGKVAGGVERELINRNMLMPCAVNDSWHIVPRA
jgi:hypothetical protein